MVGIEKNSGFTIIELLIVVVIMGLLMSLVAPTMFSKVDSTKISTARAQMQMLQTSLDTFMLDMGSYPKDLTALRESTGAGWDGPYLPKRVRLDPWGNKYQYKQAREGRREFLLFSLGKDGQPGGEDDAADVIHQ